MAFGREKAPAIPSLMPEFDTEVEIKKDFAKAKSLKEKLEARAQELKTVLRKGEEKKEFEDTQTLLHGYLAAQKVVQRLSAKK